MSGFRHGYWEGVKRSARIYVLVATTLMVLWSTKRCR
jgi:hypothetical protein